jgi:hypothetical protein
MTYSLTDGPFAKGGCDSPECSRTYRWTRGADVIVSKVPGPTERLFARDGCGSRQVPGLID